MTVLQPISPSTIESSLPHYAFIVTILVNGALTIFYHRLHRGIGLYIIDTTNEAVSSFLEIVWTPLFLLLSSAYIVAPQLFAWATFETPMYLRWGGILLGLGTTVFAFYIGRSLGASIAPALRIKAGQELVTHGTYRYIRHPLYFNSSLLLLSLMLMTSNLMFAGLFLVGSVLMRYVVIPREEVILRFQYGTAYDAYAQHTGIWFPHRRRRLDPTHEIKNTGTPDRVPGDI